MNNPKWLNYLKGTALVCLCTFLIVLTIAAWKAGAAIDSINTAAVAAQKPIASAGELTERVNRFVTIDELRNLKNNLDTSTLTAQQTANAYSAVADETVRTMRRHVQPQIDALGKEAQSAIVEAREATAELRAQIKQNGDSARALLDEGKTLVADSRVQVVELLKELNQTAHGLSVITNDAQLQEMITNLNRTSDAVAGTGENIEIISGELRDLSTYLIEPIVRPKPPKNGFDKFLYRPLLKVFGVINGAGNLLFVINKLNP